MSKVARERALKREAKKLFGDYKPKPPGTQIPENEALRQHAKRLRDLAERGMNTKKYLREAEKAEKQAIKLEKGE
jgi:hypothetical protein